MPKVTIPFAPWRPDVAHIDTQFALVAENVIPGPGHYHSFQGPAAATTAVLSGTVCGLTFTRLSTGAYGIFAGTTTKLWKYNSASGGSWTDVSRSSGGAYAVAAGDRWSFQQSGTQLVAVHPGDDPQVIEVNSGSSFTALAGSPPRATSVKQIGDFLVLSGLTSNNRRIQWSAIADITGWTVGTNLSDIQEFPEGGPVVGVSGGEVGLVVQDRTLRTMQFLPGDTTYIFNFSRVESEKGCMAKYAYTFTGQRFYFLGEDGFFSFGAGGLVPIGNHVVDTWFRSNSDPARRTQVICYAPSNDPHVVWAFHSSSTSTTYDRLIIYDWNVQQWSYGKISAQAFAVLAPPGIDLDTDSAEIGDPILDYPDLPSLDSGSYIGGRPVVGIIDPNGILCFLTGSTLAATIDTAEMHLTQGGRSFVTGVYPITDMTDGSVSVSERERPGGTVTWTNPANLETTGWASLLSSARLHRFRYMIPAGMSHKAHIQGIQIDVQPDGEI